MHEAVDAEGYEGQDEEEDDDYDGDYVVLLDHFGGGRPRESRFAGVEVRRGVPRGFRGWRWSEREREVVVGSGRFRLSDSERRSKFPASCKSRDLLKSTWS